MAHTPQPHENSTTGATPCARANLSATVIARNRQIRTEREPSSARSAFDHGSSVKSVWTSTRVGGCCEPRTARAPVAVSECALSARKFLLGFTLIELLEVIA